MTPHRMIGGRIWAALLLFLLLLPFRLLASTSAASDSPTASRRHCQATGDYRFEFPREFFAHPCFKTEWWYFTGNLESQDGRRFGFELTFFREGIDNPYSNPSRWRVDDLYLAHFAISDLNNGKFYYTQKLNRAGIGLAGVDAARGRIWNTDWSAQVGANEWKIRAGSEGNRIDLSMISLKPPALHGKNGLSQKAAGDGHASYYFSLTRLQTNGKISIGGKEFQVAGLSWMDREFFTNSLDASQTGWDWVSLPLDDGTEWMFYRMRRADGSSDPYSSGSFISREGKVTHIGAPDFQMVPLELWQSPHNGANYPIRWRITVPRYNLDIELRTPLPNQELVGEPGVSPTYWEGSVDAQGSRESKRVSGRGYLEMTGYAGSITESLRAKPSKETSKIVPFDTGITQSIH